jgi:hypothetical protein
LAQRAGQGIAPAGQEGWREALGWWFNCFFDIEQPTRLCRVVASQYFLPGTATPPVQALLSKLPLAKFLELRLCAGLKTLEALEVSN